jgi:peptide/nickel transport system ATP-binding protein
MQLGRIVEIGPGAEVFGNPPPPLHAGAAFGGAQSDPQKKRSATMSLAELSSPVHPVGFTIPLPEYRDLGAGHRVLVS